MLALAGSDAHRYDGGRASVPAPMLVSCVAYENGRKIADIPVADISEYVHRPDCFVWVALFEPTRPSSTRWRDEFDLHELAVEDARKGHQRPKIEEYGDSLFAVLHPVELVKLEDGTDDLRIGEVERLRRHELRALGPPSHAAGLRRRARAHRARARAAAPRRRASCSTR